MARWRVPSQLRRFSLRFATNSPDVPDAFPFSWTPPTEFTFDAGIAVMGEAGSGVYWAADEDCGADSGTRGADRGHPDVRTE